MVPLMIVQTAADTAPAAWWVTPVIALFAALFGGGGVGAVMKARADRRLGIAAQEVTEDDAVSKRWQSIIEAQTESLISPLRTRLAEVEANVARLERDLAVQRTKYWRAVAYIRSLLTWIRLHVAAVEPPVPPAEVAEDL